MRFLTRVLDVGCIPVQLDAPWGYPRIGLCYVLSAVRCIGRNLHHPNFADFFGMISLWAASLHRGSSYTWHDDRLPRLIPGPMPARSKGEGWPHARTGAKERAVGPRRKGAKERAAGPRRKGAKERAAGPARKGAKEMPHARKGVGLPDRKLVHSTWGCTGTGVQRRWPRAAHKRAKKLMWLME